MERVVRRAVSWQTKIFSHVRPVRRFHDCSASYPFLRWRLAQDYRPAFVGNQLCRSDRTPLHRNLMQVTLLMKSAETPQSNELGRQDCVLRGASESRLCCPSEWAPCDSFSGLLGQANIQFDRRFSRGQGPIACAEEYVTQRALGAMTQNAGVGWVVVRDCRGSRHAYDHGKARHAHTLTLEKPTPKKRLDSKKFLELNKAELDEVERGVRVGLLASPSHEFVGGMFATWLSGGVVVPLGLSHSNRELTYVMKDAGVSMIATTLEHLDTAVPLAEACSAKLILLPPMRPSPSEESLTDTSLLSTAGSVACPTEPCIGFEGNLGPVGSSGMHMRTHPHEDKHPSECTSSARGNISAANGVQRGDNLGKLVDTCTSNITSRMDGDSPALIIYTSGTTGHPKGVVHTHKGLMSQVQSLVKAWEWSPADTILHCLPGHHIHGLVNALLCPVFVGARIHFLRKFNPLSVWEHWCASYPVEDEQPEPVTVFMGVPTMYAKLVQVFDQSSAQQQKRFTAAAGQLRLMVCGSSACPVPLLKRWHGLTGHWLLERYGMTEFGMALSNPLHGERRPGFVGQPLPGVEVKILEEKQEADVSGREEEQEAHVSGREEEQEAHVSGRGKESSTHAHKAAAAPTGELCVKSAGMFKEYWRMPEKTEEAFDEEGYFRTGDTVTVVDGSYKILGRTSVDIIKSAGYKISALEIESTILEHPEVAECAVLGVPDSVYGEVVAAVVALKFSKHCRVSDPHFHSTHALELAELREWARKFLAPYKVPRLMRFVDFIPRNALGKVNKKKLLLHLFPELM